jgi:hypothetical protein
LPPCRGSLCVLFRMPTPGSPSSGVPDRTRTCDPQFRKLLLYPAELRGRVSNQCVREPFALRRRARRRSDTRTRTRRPFDSTSPRPARAFVMVRMRASRLLCPSADRALPHKRVHVGWRAVWRKGRIPSRCRQDRARISPVTANPPSHFSMPAGRGTRTCRLRNLRIGNHRRTASHPRSRTMRRHRAA